MRNIIIRILIDSKKRDHLISGSVFYTKLFIFKPCTAEYVSIYTICLPLPLSEFSEYLHSRICPPISSIHIIPSIHNSLKTIIPPAISLCFLLYAALCCYFPLFASISHFKLFSIDYTCFILSLLTEGAEGLKMDSSRMMRVVSS